jgi:hypothetical protein
MISNIISIPLNMVVGIMSDTFKVWKLMVIFTFLAAFFQAIMVLWGQLGMPLYIGFVGSTAFIVTVLLLVTPIS